MTASSLHIVDVFAGLAALTSSLVLMESQESAQARLVEIEGLKSTYPFCAPVDFSVRNISEQDFYAQVYPENFDSGSWTISPYDIHAGTMYVKRVLTEADILKAGTSWTLSYNRCLPPTDVKEDTRTFRRTIKEKDKKGNAPILQRIRLELYVRDQGRLKLAQKAWSQSFERIADKKPAQSRAH